jgi:hypothetical protein
MTPSTTTVALSVWITGYKYIPYNNSELEVDHTLAGGGITRYSIASIQHAGIQINGQDVLELNFSTAGTGGSSTSGLQYALYDGQVVTIRALQNQKVTNVATIHPTRPSTSLQYSNNLASIYRIINYGLTESTGESLVTTSFGAYATLVSGSTSSSVMTVSVSSGSISTGQLVTGSGFNGTFTVYNVSLVGGSTYVVTLSSPPSLVPSGTITFSNQINTTSMLETDASFNYYQFSSDPTSVDVADPTPYTTGYAIGTVASGATNSYTLTVTSSTLTGTITAGMTVGGFGFSNGGITVSNVSGPSGGVYTVTLSAYPTSTPVGSVWFSTRTQGLQIGDNKIAVTAIAQASTIAQINTGSYITSWGGRTHLIKSYTPPVVLASGTYVSGGVASTTMVISSVAGTLYNGALVTGTGFTGGQTIVSFTGPSSGNYTVVLSGVANSQPSGSLSFGTPSNAYLTIDPNPIYNLAANGITAPALTFAGAQYNVNGTLNEYVTFNVANLQSSSTTTPPLPPVDSYLTISGQSTTAYNGTVQVVGTNSTTTLTVSSTSGLSVGMVVSSTTQYAIVPTNCIVQSVSADGQTFTVSPAVWLPSGANITASFPTTIASISVTNAGSGEYTTAPTLTFSGGGAITQAQATANILGGYITNVTLINGGYGYTSAPTVTASFGTATFTAILSSNVAFSSTITSQSESTQVTVAYPTAVGSVTGTLTSVATTGTYLTLNSVTGLTINNQIIFTTATNGTALGNIKSGTPYYILSINSGSNQITVSLTMGGSAIDPGTASGTNPYMTFVATSWTYSASVTPSAVGAPSGSGSGFYTVTYTIPSTSIVNGAYYKVMGSTNPMHNGVWICTSSTNATATSITLQYPSTPGTFTGSASTVSITRVVTTSSASTLGVAKPFSTQIANALRVGYSSGATGQIITNISTCRATGHDFNQIGTGGYNTSNYPNTIFGAPAIAANPVNQVREETVGRVFYVSTDENGIFKVGPYFEVDQGTGTVTFSASIALSNLSGLGFKQGVVITQFSTDGTMADNSTAEVPVQSAIRSFVDYRLGLTYSGAPTPASQLIGPGYMPLNGVLAMKSNMNMGSFNINNVATPLLSTDAANKGYVDTRSFVANLSDVTVTNPVSGNILVYDTTSGTATATTASTNVINVSNLTNFQVGDAITFTGSGFGGISAGTYYILTTSGSSGSGTITVSQTANGAVVPLSTASGSLSYVSTRWRNIQIPQGTGNLVTTGGSGTGSIATLTFSTQGTVPFVIGQTIVVTGVSPTGYNGIYTVTNATTGSVSYSCTATGSLSVNGTVIGNTTAWTYEPASGTLTTAINSNTIVDSMVNTTAQIQQTKLAMIPAQAVSSQGTAFTSPLSTVGSFTNLGLSSYNSSVFSVSSGWVDLANSSSSSTGVLPSKLAYLNPGQLLANWSGSGSTYPNTQGDGTAQHPSAVAFDTVVKFGNGVTNAPFTATGLMTVTSVGNLSYTGISGGVLTGGNNTYGVTTVSSGHGNGVVPISDASGNVDVTALKISGYTAITATGATSFNFYTPSYSSGAIIQLSGNTSSNLTVTMPAILDTTGGTIYTNKIAAGNTNNVSSTATIQGQWSLVSGSTFIATYSADLAEYYEGDAEYEVGTVVVFGGEKEITVTNAINDTRLAGVVGEQGKAAYIMYSDCPGLKNLVALAGRVPCKVVGKVKKGDMLTTAAMPGYACKAVNPTLGSIIGKALEDKDYSEAGIIEVAVGRN